MSNTTKQKESKRAGSLKDIPRSKLVAEQLEAFLGFPTSTPPAERFKALAIRFQTSTKNLQQTARRHRWKEKLEAVAKARKEQEAFEQTLIDAAPQRLDIPSSVIARSLKDLSFTLLSTAQRVVRSASVLIEYYSGQISALVASKGGYGYLNEDELKQLAGWQAQIATQAKSIEAYLKPGSIAALLEQTNFRTNLPLNLDDVEQGAFTPARLQQALADLGMVTAFALARGEAPPANDSTFAPFTTDLPELPPLDGWTNARPGELDNLRTDTQTT